MRVLLKYTWLFVVLLSLAGCGRPNQHEVSRVTSPDHLVDAVIAEEDTDATVATPTLLYIVPTGAKITNVDSVLLADHVENLSLSWKAPKKLVVSYSSARIFSFVNFWESKDVENFQYVVRVYLRDTSAPR